MLSHYFQHDSLTINDAPTTEKPAQNFEHALKSLLIVVFFLLIGREDEKFPSFGLS